MKFKPADPAIAEVDMTPMIDIVFQLIAFFMVVINFEQTQADERVKLPRDELARPPLKARAEKYVLNVGYIRDKEGNQKGGPFIWVPGANRQEIKDKDDPRYPNGFKWPEDEKAFADELQKIKRSKEREGEDKIKKTTIVIRADGEADSGIATDIINACQLVGFEKFALAATQKGGQKQKSEE